MQAVKTAMLAGTTVYELTEKYPDKILRAIKDYGVVKLGEMEVDVSVCWAPDLYFLEKATEQGKPVPTGIASRIA